LLAAIIAASALSILPIANITPAKAAGTSNWVFQLKDTLNETIGAGEATAELWNYTYFVNNASWVNKGKVAGPIAVGANGIVVMPLPEMWNITRYDPNYWSQIHYVLVVKWTPGGVSTPFILLNRTVSWVEDCVSPGTHFMALKPGGAMLNLTVWSNTPYFHTYPSPDNTKFGHSLSYPVYMVWLGRAIVQPVDWSGYPLTGASVEMILNATDKSETDRKSVV